MLLRVLDFWLEGTERAMALMTLLAVSGDGMTSCARQMRPGCRGASTRAAQEEGGLNGVSPPEPSARGVLTATIAMRRVARYFPCWGDPLPQGRVRTCCENGRPERSG